jgi:peptidyl-prolyl cis-trans isomerase SurA
MRGETVDFCMMREWIGRRFGLAAAAVIAASIAASSPAAAQQVVVFVNGAPITTYDIDQRSKFIQLSAKRTPSRQEVLDALIEDTIKIQEALRYNMDAPKGDVDRAIGNMSSRAGLSVPQFTQMIAANGVNIETIKSRMRSEIAWTNLVRARFPATLQVEEKDVMDALQTKKEEGDAVAFDYRLRPILFIVPKGSTQSIIDGRIREAESLRGRFQDCEDGIRFARSLRDVAVRDPVRRSSADLPNNLRDLLNNTPVGKLTKPEVTAQGVEVFALCERKENTSDTPQKRTTRQQLFASRFEAQSKRYLNDLRRGAMIEYK